MGRFQREKGGDMTDAPDREKMTATLAETVEKAEKKLGKEQGARLAEVMRSLCLDLTDIEAQYFVVFEQDGSAGFSTRDPGLEPMLTITTTAAVFHSMALGKSNPAVELAMRKVKMSGVPMTRLAKVGGPLIDTLFSCYKESAGE